MKISYLAILTILSSTSSVFAADEIITVKDRKDINGIENTGWNEYVDPYISHDGSTVVYINDDSDVYVFDMKTGKTPLLIDKYKGKTFTPVGVSADGSVIAGWISVPNKGVYYKDGAFHEIDAPGIGLTLGGVSGDGRYLIGSGKTDNLAYYYDTGNNTLTSLGYLDKVTPEDQNQDMAFADVISLSGNAIIGRSSLVSNDIYSVNRGYVYYLDEKEMKDLGSLRSDGKGTSDPSALSADGGFVVGAAEDDNGNDQAFVYSRTSGDMKQISSVYYEKNGEITISNTPLDGYNAISGEESEAVGISDDGRRVIVNSQNDVTENGNVISGNHSYIYSTDSGNIQLINSAENGKHYTVANAISGNGKVVVGKTTDDTFYPQSFAFLPDSDTLKLLGNLTNGTYSEATAVSEDGTIVYGNGNTGNSNEKHLMMWLLDFMSEGPGKENPIDVTNTLQTINLVSKDTYKVLDLYQSALFSLSDNRCQMGDSNYCLGVFTQHNSVSDNKRTATGVFGSFRLPDAKNWTIGGAVNFAVHTDLVESFDTENNKPGLGVYARYQENKDESGWNAEISAAHVQQDLEITRKGMTDTEPAKGDSAIKGYLIQTGIGYGINVADNLQVTPFAAIKHYSVERDSYTENHVKRPVKYGKAGNKNTDLQLGSKVNFQVNKYTEVDFKAGADFKLHNSRDNFTGYFTDTLGADIDMTDSDHNPSVKPFVAAGVNINMGENSVLRIDAGWQKTNYNNDSASVNIGYSYKW